MEVFESFDSLAIIVWTVDFESKPQDSEMPAELLKVGIGGGLEGMEQEPS